MAEAEDRIQQTTAERLVAAQREARQAIDQAKADARRVEGKAAPKQEIPGQGVDRTQLSRHDDTIKKIDAELARLRSSTLPPPRVERQLQEQREATVKSRREAENQALKQSLDQTLNQDLGQGRGLSR